jgi:MFS family permease
MLFGSVDQELLTVKTFYFFFYSAFGSLFPLMGVYFKQMGMNPFQCGLLVGARPFVEFLSAPFWGSYADRSRKGKVMLLASLAAWIIFTLPLGFIQPPATSCIRRVNETFYELKTPEVQRILKRSVDNLQQLIEEPLNSHVRDRRAVRPVSEAGVSPLGIEYVNEFNPKFHKDMVSPLFSSIVYRTDDIHKAFFLLMLLVIIGEFFSAPAITLADSAVITLLGEDADRYGHQRMFGSLGWGVAMFFVGIALDQSTSFPDHPCGPEKQEKNYTICFATFAVAMTAALIAATQINFKYPEHPEEMEFQAKVADPVMTKEDEMQNQLAAQLGIPSLGGGAGSAAVPSSKPAQPSLGAQTKMFAQRLTTETPEWILVFTQFSKDIKLLSFLFVAWFLGFGIGLIFTFLFWHLQDYGGSPTLFGVASVINHLSEIFAYFFSFRLITQIGHVKVSWRVTRST